MTAHHSWAEVQRLYGSQRNVFVLKGKAIGEGAIPVENSNQNEAKPHGDIDCEIEPVLGASGQSLKREIECGALKMLPQRQPVKEAAHRRHDFEKLTFHHPGSSGETPIGLEKFRVTSCSFHYLRRT